MQRAHHALDVVELHEGEHLVRLLVLDIDFLHVSKQQQTDYPLGRPVRRYRRPPPVTVALFTAA